MIWPAEYRCCENS